MDSRGCCRSGSSCRAQDRPKRDVRADRPHNGLVRARFAAVLLPLSVSLSAQPPQSSQPRDGMEMRESIPTPDGVRLAADLYVPAGAPADARFPVLLEYLPYRKTEGRGRNWPLYSYFVQRGYVVARVDIRGTGNSEGRLMPYEYSDIEHDDGEVVIDWLSKQPWSNGNVGMFGISWGGFNAIQMAARNPPALKAIHRRGRDRGPLPGRRPLHRRHHAPRLLGDEPGPRQRASGRSRLRDRRGLLPRPLRHASRGC